MIKLIHLNLLMLWIFMFMLIFFIMIKFVHPMILMILLIIYTLMICLMMSFWKFNYLYSILLFLMMISGLLIIFMYFSSLISNEQVMLNYNKFKLILIFIMNLSMIMFYLKIKKFVFFNSLNNFFYEINPFNMMFLSKFSNILNLFNYSFNNMTIFCMFMILLVFITIIKINLSIHSFSMRKILNE